MSWLLLAFCMNAASAPPPTAPTLLFGTSSAAPQQVEEDYARIIPGTGFTEAAAVTPLNDNPARATESPTAIARFDAVPYQVFGGDIYIGVVAFHINGIDNVAFSAAGGPSVKVTHPQMNPQTRVWEYTAVLRASDLPDGRVEVRAVANPVRGTPRVLPPLVLWANGHGTLPHPERFVSLQGNDASGKGTREAPFRTIARAVKSLGKIADNATIFVGPGQHEYGSPAGQDTGIGWLTITAAPGNSADDVRLVSSEPHARVQLDRVRLVNVTLDQRNSWRLAGGRGGATSGLWLDNVVAMGPGPLKSSPTSYGISALYITGAKLSGYFNGANEGLLLRDTHYADLGSDAFPNAAFVVNSSVDNIDRGTSSAHPDIWQLVGADRAFDNLILYNVRATNVRAQGVFIKDLKSIANVAIVNLSIDKVAGPYMSQWYGVPSDHILIWHVSMPNSTWAWRGARLTNASIVGSLFGRVVMLADKDGKKVAPDPDWYHNNHFVNGHSDSLVLGDGATVGDPGVVMRAGVLVPSAKSVLKNRVERDLVPIDLAGEARHGASSVGAFD